MLKLTILVMAILAATNCLQLHTQRGHIFKFKAIGIISPVTVIFTADNILIPSCRTCTIPYKRMNAGPQPLEFGALTCKDEENPC